MANSDSTFNPSRSRIEEGNFHKDNLDDRARTVEMLRKLEKMEEKSPNNNNNMLVAVDLPMRKSASFQNITEISEDCSVDLQRRGSDSRSMPNSPTGGKKRAATGGRRQKPWELRRSSTPIPGALDVTSILRKALERFSPEVGHSSVEETGESDE